MKLTKREDGWWITDTPEGIEEMGPYDTKAEAQDDLRGVERFIKFEIPRKVKK